MEESYELGFQASKGLNTIQPIDDKVDHNDNINGQFESISNELVEVSVLKIGLAGRIDWTRNRIPPIWFGCWIDYIIEPVGTDRISKNQRTSGLNVLFFS